jgi:two-component system nitrogen regulation response regulator NtrX
MVCDDEEDIRLVCRVALESLGVEVTEAVDGDDCIARVEETCPDLVILDLFMPNRDGLSALPEIKRRCPTARVLVVSAHGAEDTFARCRQRGATACFDKLSFVARIPRVVERYSAVA